MMDTKGISSKKLPMKNNKGLKNVADATAIDASVAKTQLSKKTKNCPTPIPTVMATPTQQTRVQSTSMYNEEYKDVAR